MDTMPPEPSHVESDAHSDDNIHVSVGEGATNVAAGKNVTQYVGYSAEQVSALITQVRTAEQPRTWDGRVPYVGLAAFQEADAEFFFGREKLVDTLLERIQETRFLCIAGPSGSGKSSLVQAGLIHALRSGRLAGSRHWLYASLSPRGDPIEQLALAMARVAGKPDVANYLRNSGPTDPSSLQQQAETLLGPDPAQRLILYIDQFEELFTQTRNEIRRQSFLALLTDAIAREDGRVTVILSMRSDFMSQCATYPELLSLINQQFQLVGAMTSQELALAILKPALVVGAEIEPDLVAQVIADMKGEPGALPLMQFALKDLFGAHPHKRGDVVKLALSDYIDRGGIEEALERHANAAFALFDEAQREIARRVFTHLIDVGRGTFDTRRTAAYAELSDLNPDTAGVRSVIAVLTDARLLTTDALEEPGVPSVAPAATVTIAHEKLIEAWPWLRRLVNENREAIALQNDIADDAQQWYSSVRDPSYLYTGARLATAREQVTGRKIRLTGLAGEFIATAAALEDTQIADKLAAQRRQIRRRNWAIAILSAILLPIFAVMLFSGVRQLRRDRSPWKAVAHFPKDKVFALSYGKVQAGDSLFYCVGTIDLGVACSYDGRSWNIYQSSLPIGKGPPSGVGNFPGEQRGITGVAIDAVQSSIIYVYAMNGEIYKSADSGQHWQATGATLPPENAVALSARGSYLVAVAKRYRDDQGHSLYFSADGGQHWDLEIKDGESPFGRVHTALLTNEPALYIGTDAGIFQTTLGEALVWKPVLPGVAVLLLQQALDDSSMIAVSAAPTGESWSLLRVARDGAVETLTTFKQKPISLTIDPSPTSTTPLYVLLEKGEVVAITVDRQQRSLGGLWRFGPAWSILAAPDEDTGNTRLFMGHWSGLLEYQLATH